MFEEAVHLFVEGGVPVVGAEDVLAAALLSRHEQPRPGSQVQGAENHAPGIAAAQPDTGDLPAFGPPGRIVESDLSANVLIGDGPRPARES